MIEAIAPLRSTALPAVLFLVWLPAFLLWPGRRTAALFYVAGLVTLVVVAGPVLAGGLFAAILGGYGLTEWVARQQRRRGVALAAALVLVHAVYWACFHLPRPAAFGAAHLRPADAPGLFVLFSGIGLTFFRLVSYLSDRVRRNAPRLPLRDYLAYMLFFPQFRHGPIERGHAFAAKLRAARRDWTPRQLGIGLLRLLVGLAGLVALLPVSQVVFHFLPRELRAEPTLLFTNPELLSLPQLLLMMHVPGLVLYLVESSFASIQLGVGRVFGVRGSENFRYALLFRDPRELWQRWNITLFRWLRDYAYVPLCRIKRLPNFHILPVFVYCGLLHSLQWRCVLWGLYTGGGLAVYAAVSDALKKRRARGHARTTHPLTRVLGTVLLWTVSFHWVCLGSMILLDPDYCGSRVLGRYLQLLVASVTG